VSWTTHPRAPADLPAVLAVFNASDVLEFGQPEMDLAEVQSALRQADLAWVAEFSKERPYDEWAALMLSDVEVVCAIRDGVLVGARPCL
jgi:hypothetical protein